jgi:uncharacterized protein YecE (DUF72 family)
MLVAPVSWYSLVMPSEIRFGTCGWSFPDWKSTFYASQFDAVEIGSTWYRIPTVRTVESWGGHAPGSPSNS